MQDDSGPGADQRETHQIGQTAEPVSDGELPETPTAPAREDPFALTIVGLGGSAGSIPALEAFFQNVPPGDEVNGSAYVVVLHLSPSHESNLADLLSRSTTMPVRQVTDPVKVERNHVYVIPPGRQLEMTDGSLHLRDLEPEEGVRVAVDNFFRSLADAHGPQSVAVVLSGTGMDGTLGLRQIKEVGGLSVVQSPLDAQFDAMPRSAIATGMVDYVLPAAAMPAQIAAYWETSRQMRLPEEAAPSPSHREEGPDQEAAITGILSHIHAQTGHEFHLYKRATVLRRIARRLQVNGLQSLPDYLDYLLSHPSETSDLVGDLLISVTQFFRDREAWEALERDVIPALFKNKEGQDQLRVWVCGSATGEEAYTLAMLLLEGAARLPHPPKIQVFATDMDADAIGRARTAIYPETIVADVSPERLRRWFHWQNGTQGTYQVRRELREVVLFASHDVLRDTPFSRLDLVTCRNLLIYLNREAQSRVFQTFHFALRPEGRLMLGSSESLGTDAPLFALIDKEQRLYVRRPHARSVALPIPSVITPMTPASSFNSLSNSAPRRGSGQNIGQNRAPNAGQNLGQALSPNDALLSLPSQIPASAIPFSPEEVRVPGGRPMSGVRRLFVSLLERYGLPTALVNESYNVLHLSNGAVRFLRLVDGEPTHNLLSLVHPDLRIELRTALYAVAVQGSQEETRLLRSTALAPDRPPVPIRLRVRPVEPPEDSEAGVGGYLLVQFEELPAELFGIDENVLVESAVSASAASVDLVQQLEEENALLQRQLRATVEQYEAITEELKASNEELQSMNEEQRSATEELETSREELQSVNEELTTVNHELKARVDEVTNTNSDLQNFLASTDIGTLFLDRELRIKRYTPAAEALFHLIPADAGRPLAHVTHRLDYPGLTNDAESVLARLLPVEREVATRDGERHFLARFVPYRSLDDRIEGVVLTFVDLTARKRAEEALRLSEEKYRSLFSSIDEGFCTIEVLFDENGQGVDYRFLDTNPTFEAQTGLIHATGRTMRELVPDMDDFWFRTYGNVALSGESIRFDQFS
ncbi:MAG: chemotaxis protein CheB, partial [Armatimonadota bacterium]